MAPKKPAAKKAEDAAPKAEKPPALTIAQRLDEYGIDAICERIQNMESLTDIARSFGWRNSKIIEWLAADPVRSARAREARASSASQWDDDAMRRIDAATDSFELAKAKEAAHHLRWRASKIAPKEYGDKVTQEHTGVDGAPIDMNISVSFVKPSGGNHD